MRKLLWLILLFTILLSATLQNGYSQVETGAHSITGRGGVAATFVTDYQAIGVNPANLGVKKSFRDPKFTIGFFETSATFFSGAFSRKELFNAISNSKSTRFSYEEKSKVAKNLANKDNAVNANITLIGMSWRLKGNQSIAFSISDKIQVYAKLNSMASEIAFLGSNASYFPYVLRGDVIGSTYPNPRNSVFSSTIAPLTEQEQQAVYRGTFLDSSQSQTYAQILDGTRISSSWFREYNFSYGRQIVSTYNFSLYAGIGIKYIAGMVYIDLLAENNQLTRKNISVSPSFGLSFGDANNPAAQAPSFQNPQNIPLWQQLLIPKPIGNGYGLDIGITMQIKRNFYLSAALNNYGKITWDGNVYEVTNGKLVEFAGSGFNNYNLLGADQGALQFAGDKSPLKWNGVSAINIDLPSTIRLGASYEYYRTIHAGIDIIIPRNNIAGNLETTFVGLGIDYRPLKLFKISTGLNGGGNNGSKISFPFGFTYIARKGFYEAGIATGDLTTYVADTGQGSKFSLALGFVRIKI
jgi:hypothetical protein